MSRRKGERPVARPLDRFHDGHPVAHRLRTGDHWMQAWVGQKSTPLSVLTRATGIPVPRLLSIMPGAEVSRAELDALARAWSISTGDLVISIGEANPIVD